MNGVLPRQQRIVKPYAYVVKDGDTVSSIAKTFTGDPRRWPELVGANLHRPLGREAVGGTPYRVFQTLHAGESLLIPAQWPQPRMFQYTGSVGEEALFSNAGMFSTGRGLSINKQQSEAGGIDAALGVMTQYVNAYAPMIFGGPVPTVPGYTPNDIYAVATNWLPYLTQYFPTSVPPGVTPVYIPPIQTPQDLTAVFIKQLIESAIAFLMAQNLGNPTPIPTGNLPNVLPSIPWDAIPWNAIPWQQLGIVLPQRQQREVAFPLVFGEKPVQQALTLKGQVGAPVGGPPNLLDKNIWTQQPMAGAASFGLDAVPWDKLPPGWQTDATVLGCMQAHPERLKDIVDNQVCFKDKVDLAKTYLCDTSKTIAQVCTGATQGCPTGQYPNPLANGACQDPLVCKEGETFDPTKWQCVAPTPKAEEKSNMPLYIGLGVAGIALVAGIVVLTARD